MEVILSYLENMFLSMPQTPEVLRAKAELASMMEDKYNELLAEGKKENEAVGIVISEFGDLNELAEELGLVKLGGANTGSYTEGYAGNQQEYGKEAKVVSLPEAEDYLQASIVSAKRVSIGVMLCIYSPIMLLVMGGIDEAAGKVSDLSFILFGLIPLFVLIGIAVAIFICNGVRMEKYEYLKKERIQIDRSVEKYLDELAEEERPHYTRNLVTGVTLCIFAALPLMIIGSITDHDVVNVMGVIILLVVIGVAVMLLIRGGMKMECIKVLKQEGEFSVSHKESEGVVGIIATIYWPLVIAIYLFWSFMTMKWGITWIVWPIAGVLFGAIAAICNLIVSAMKSKA